MTPFHTLTGPACRLPLSGVDTDQLLPARFMSQPRAEGYGGFLLRDLAHDAEGRPRPDFPLNAPEAADARIMIARRNFGGGSSREGAVYALVDRGFRCVIAPSFGDIFAANAANNGLLAARVSEAEAETLLASEGEVTADLERREIRHAGGIARFEVDPVARLKLLNGWSDVDLTASFSAEIARFRHRDRKERPWAWPTPE